MIPRTPKPKGFANDAIGSCELCGQTGAEQVATCRNCAKTYHLNCMGAMNEGTKKGEWCCDNCQRTKDKYFLQSQTGSKSASISSRRSSIQKRLDLELRQLEEQRKLDKKYLQEKYRILKEAEDSRCFSDEELPDDNHHVHQWLRLSASNSLPATSDTIQADNANTTRAVSEPNDTPPQYAHTAARRMPLPTNNQDADIGGSTLLRTATCQPKPMSAGKGACSSLPGTSSQDRPRCASMNAVASDTYPRMLPSIQNQPRMGMDIQEAEQGDSTLLRVSTCLSKPTSAGKDAYSLFPDGNFTRQQEQRLQVSAAEAEYVSRTYQNPLIPLKPTSNIHELAVAFARRTVPQNEQCIQSSGQDYQYELRANLDNQRQQSTKSQGAEAYVYNSSSDQPGVNYQFEKRNPAFMAPALANISTRRLNTDQIGARQVMPRDLQPFSGRPEEWPLFISTFESSTEICGYSNEENLPRLQRCLKGPAMDAVRFRLMTPSGVPGAIDTLRMLYGRPELIINTLISELRKEAPPKMDRLESIIRFALTIQNITAVMESSNLVDHLCNPMLLQEFLDKLPPQMKLEWARHKQTLPKITICDFSSWIYEIGRSASEVTLPSSTDFGYKENQKPTRNRNFINVHSQERQISPTPEEKCVICEGNCTRVEVCDRFRQMGRSQKWLAVNSHNLCRTCLKDHGSDRCESTKRCMVDNCPRRHHPLLHKAEKEPRENVTVGASAVHQHLAPNETGILFRILPVTLSHGDSTIDTYAFLDDGSSLSLMDEKIAQELNLPGKQQQLCLKWTGDTQRMEVDSRSVTLGISSMDNPKRKFTMVNVHTVRELGLPEQTIDMKKLSKEFKHLKGIPVRSYTNMVPRILIGLDNWSLALPLKSREGSKHEPIASKTRLGWSIYGNAKRQTFDASKKSYNYHICECQREADQNLHKLVKSYYELDHMGVPKPEDFVLSKDDQRALSILETTTRRQGRRYETGLLWKFDLVSLPDSYEMAKRRLVCLERKLLREQELENQMQQRLKDHLDKGYIRKLSPEELGESQSRVWYLPIFPIVNPNKPGKFRIVWDAAAEVRGISLNSVLLKGPDQLSTLISILLRFRERRVAICGDIKEMFHRVKIRTEDQSAQRFLWRMDKAMSEPEVFVVQVMLFGATCSPSCAQHIKNKNAMEHKDKYPRAVQAILHNHYVDDFLDSVDTEEEAIQLATDVYHVHQQGGFEMRNWLSNSPAFSKAFAGPKEDKKDLNIISEQDTEQDTEKVLGMWWSTKTDMFMYMVDFQGKYKELLTGHKTPSKREVLRVLMSMYDPLGLLAHYLIYAKILLQDIWRSDIDWDEPIKAAELAKWQNWLRLLPEVGKIRIPRCYSHMDLLSNSDNQLHIFVDASENAYAAVIYLRMKGSQGTECCLLTAKTRVAPLKGLSIPRMELEAALLGTKLATTTQDALSIRITSKHFWTDSKVVIAWLNSDQRKYRQFVAFRVGQILESSEIREWRWIPSKLNAADPATKWKPAPDLRSDSQWYTGPEFLLLEPEFWPLASKEVVSTQEEIRGHVMHVRTCPELIRAGRFTQWRMMIKACALLYRYFNNIRKRLRGVACQTDGRVKEEYAKAESLLYRQAQKAAFSKEIQALKSNQVIGKGSVLYKLSAYLDDDGVLRVRGRIDASCGYSSDDTRRPIILPRQHRITELLVQSYHFKFYHRNAETVVNEIKQKYYIPSLRTAVKLSRKTCPFCKIQDAQPSSTEMSALPPARLAPFTRPFSYIGIDYFGPMKVRIGRRNEKRWGVLITCLTVRAIHIELASTLSTDSCIHSLRKFIARRGTPLQIYSDNGTNFRGASRELRNACNEIDHKKVAERFISSTTEWIFIPPASPHMGGCWERLVRSVKSVLANVLANRNPKEEELYSALLEVKATVNSRPLTYVPVASDDDEALTPNHFILGSSSGVKPVGEFSDDGVVLRRSWMVSQSISNSFWRRWIKEYLPTLTRRSKWFHPVKPVKTGDIVIVIDPVQPRNTWPKGRIVETISGSDGQVRSAMVQTATGIYQRPVVKLAVLDVRATVEEKCKPKPDVETSVVQGGSVGDSATAGNTQ